MGATYCVTDVAFRIVSTHLTIFDNHRMVTGWPLWHPTFLDQRNTCWLSVGNEVSSS